jgi:hypothetical protein
VVHGGVSRQVRVSAVRKRAEVALGELVHAEAPRAATAGDVEAVVLEVQQEASSLV